MVTLLDIGLLQRFEVIFPFLFVLVLLYAILSRMTWFKDTQAVAFLIAFALAVMTLMSSIAVKTINRMAPWFVLLVVFGVFFILAYVSFGVKEGTIEDVLTKSEHSGTFAWWVLALMLIIGFGSLATTVSEEIGFRTLAAEEGAAAPGTPEPIGFWATIFHPKILGLVLILLIAMFTVMKLAGKAEA